VRSAATTHISRWVVVRNALGNANLVKAEAAIAIGVLGHVAWGATMLVVTFDQLGPIGPGWYPSAVLTIVAILGVHGAWPLLAIRGIDTRYDHSDGSHFVNQLAGGIGVLRRLPDRRDDFLRAITGNSTTEAAIKAIADQRLAHAGAVDLAQGDGR
jgi:hypothetical protein